MDSRLAEIELKVMYASACTIWLIAGGYALHCNNNYNNYYT